MAELDLLSKGLTTCQGCPMELVGRAALEVLGPKTITMTPPSCSAILTGSGDETGWGIPSVQTVLMSLPAFASGIALSVVWLWIYDSSPSGLFNQLLTFFHLPTQNWLGSSKTSMLSLMIMALLSGQGQNIIISTAALLGIDNTYFEAAELDGATFMQKVTRIVFPLVKPTTLFLLVTGVIGSFQVFMNAYMMTGGGPDNATTMIGLLIYNNAFTYNKYGLACAQAVILTIIIAAISFLQFKMAGSDVEY